MNRKSNGDLQERADSSAEFARRVAVEVVAGGGGYGRWRRRSVICEVNRKRMTTVEADVARLLWRMSVFEARLDQLRSRAGAPPTRTRSEHAEVNGETTGSAESATSRTEAKPTLNAFASRLQPETRAACVLGGLLFFLALLLAGSASVFLFPWLPTPLPALPRDAI